MKRQPIMTASNPIAVSVGAHTLERWDDLTGAISPVRNQVPAAHELAAVIDNDDALHDMALGKLAGVTGLANTMNSDLSGARTIGADHTSGAAIAFLDAPAVAAPGWLAARVEAYRDPEVLGAGGPVEPDWRAPRPLWFPDEFHWVVGCTYVREVLPRAVARDLKAAQRGRHRIAGRRDHRRARAHRILLRHDPLR
jgi:hypothetical protein